MHSPRQLVHLCKHKHDTLKGYWTFPLRTLFLLNKHLFSNVGWWNEMKCNWAGTFGKNTAVWNDESDLIPPYQCWKVALFLVWYPVNMLEMQHNILNARYRSCCYQSLVSFLIFVEFILTCLRCDFPLPAYVLYPPFPLYISPSVFKSVFFPSSLSVRIVLRLSVCSPWPSFISLHFHIPL